MRGVEWVFRNIYLSPETEEKLAEQAAKRGVPTNQHIREILEDYVRKHQDE